MTACQKMQPGKNPVAPSASLANLHERGKLLRKLRAFFDERGFIEVETPLLAHEIIPEIHIEPMRTVSGEFLQSSPELHMKRLVAAGATAIYQVTRSFAPASAAGSTIRNSQLSNGIASATI